MQLLNYWILNIVLTTLLVSGGTSIVVSAAAIWILPRRPRRYFWFLFLVTFAFSLLGFVTGYLLGNSREAAVGAVLPAILTLLGGVAAYHVTSKGIRWQSAISAMLVCFTLCLLVGSMFGSRIREEYDFALHDPQWIGRRELALQRNELAVDIQRLKDYTILLRLRNDYSKSKNLDLSRFKSILEKPHSEQQGKSK